MRYEFYKIDKDDKKKIINKYLYVKDWNIFHKIYNLINPDDRHFYEMIGDKCKFFLDIDGKNIDCIDWNIYLKEIEEALYKLFTMEFNLKIKVIKCQSISLTDEPKKSCHFIIPEFSFLVNDCKYICNILKNNYIKNKKILDIIDDTVYGINRCLRIPLSSKMGSKRIKIVTSEHYYESFISDIEKTKFININRSEEINIINKKDKFFKQKNNYTLNNKENLYINIINNIIDKNKKCFKIRNNGIIGNMIICDRIYPSLCLVCNRIHEKENPFLIVNQDQKKIYFYCRRNKKPTIYSVHQYIINKTRNYDNKYINTNNHLLNNELLKIYQNNILYKNNLFNSIILFKIKNFTFLISSFMNIILNLDNNKLFFIEKNINNNKLNLKQYTNVSINDHYFHTIFI